MWPYLLLGLLLSHLVSPLTIVAGALVGLLSPRSVWVVVGSVIAAIVVNVALIPLAGALGWPVAQVAEGPDLRALGVAASVVAVLIWAMVVFWIRRTCVRVVRVLRPES